MTSFQSYIPYPLASLPSLPSPLPTNPDPYMLKETLHRIRRIPSSQPYGSQEIDEASRVQLLHVAHTAALNPRHSHIIEQHLSAVHSGGRRSRVLDIGAGTGAWAVDLANTQPFADVTAVDWDWSWFKPAESVHGNLDFQTIDVSQTLPFSPGSVDLIHVKCILTSLPQYAALIERLAVVLRPGGLLILVESELGYSSPQPMSQSARTWNACLKAAMEARGVDSDLAPNLVRFIGSSGVFSSAVYAQEGAIRGGPSDSGDIESLARIGRLHPDLLSATLDRQLAELVAFGYGQEQLWPLKQTVLAELTDPCSPYLQRIFAAYAKKLDI